MITRLVDRFIARAQRRERRPIPVVTHDDRRLLFHRYQPLWPDEFVAKDGRHFNRAPWWRPFNILLHQWEGGHRETMHDHPRWSITVVLRGSVIEHTPWRSRALKPGSIVIRSRKYIHAFEIVDGEQPWTLFIVGRRNHRQNGFRVTPLGVATSAKETQKMMDEDKIKHMVERFLAWRLPENFNPDAGIKFEPKFNVGTPYEMEHKPTGTNLLSNTQAEAMVRHMIEGL